MNEAQEADTYLDRRRALETVDSVDELEAMLEAEQQGDTCILAIKQISKRMVEVKKGVN